MREFLRDNLGTKSAAVVMAVAFWVYAYQTSTEEREVGVPVVIRTPPGWTITEQSADTVSAVVRLPSRYHQEIRQIERNKELRLVFEFLPGEDAEPVMQGEFSVKQEMFEFPAEFDWLQIPAWKPDAVTFTAARNATRELRVNVRSQEPPPGFRVRDNPYVSPATVTVEGREWALSKAEEIATVPIPIPPMPIVNVPIEGPFEIEQSITVDGEKVPVVCRQNVFVRLWLEQERAERTLEKIKVNVLSQSSYPYAAKIPRDSEMEVTVSGPKDIVSAFTRDNILLYVDVNDLVAKDVPYTEQVHHILLGVHTKARVTVKLEKQTVGVEVREPGK